MPRVVAFLRAINVGGHTVEMAKLKQLFEKLSLTGVETFIASGNVIFDAPRAPAAGGSAGSSLAALEKKIAAHLEKSLGYEVVTFLRTPAELAATLAHRAFQKERAGSTLHIGFLGSPASATAKKQVLALTSDIDDFHLHGREIYWRCAGRFSDSVVSGAKLEKALGQPTTMRKHTTVEKLARKYG
jgi:uncharacterized protein (DUF1697 family)